jgi:hypothetical protein
LLCLSEFERVINKLVAMTKMIKMIKKYRWIIVFSLIGLPLIMYLLLDTNIDRKYLDNLHEYELANKEIKREYGKLKSFDEPNYKSSEGLVVNFRLNENNLKGQNTPILKKLFKNGLIEDVILTKNYGVLFKLKLCEHEDCKEHNTGFSGQYTHYLTRDKIEFINENWVRVVKEKTINNWTYYIIWTQKG